MISTCESLVDAHRVLVKVLGVEDEEVLWVVHSDKLVEHRVKLD